MATRATAVGWSNRVVDDFDQAAVILAGESPVEIRLDRLAQEFELDREW